MLTYEYKCEESKQQYAAIDEAIRVVHQKQVPSPRGWMNAASESPTCNAIVRTSPRNIPLLLVSTRHSRQASADRTWFTISRFYDNCRQHKQGPKGYPQFQHKTREEFGFSSCLSEATYHFGTHSSSEA